ncbi:hypothetical protein [Micromonospora sp. NPDC005205]|uniref:hypothetical protein n=1 Tax=Micromonospora sp. NPDC005205 TaxID=3156714 RepID=UPI0033AB80C5
MEVDYEASHDHQKRRLWSDLLMHRADRLSGCVAKRLTLLGRLLRLLRRLRRVAGNWLVRAALNNVERLIWTLEPLPSAHDAVSRDHRDLANYQARFSSVEVICNTPRETFTER